MGTTNRAEELAKEIYRDNPTDEKGADYKYNTDVNAPRKRKAFVKGYMYRQSEIDELTKEVERLRKEREKTISDFAFNILDKKYTTNEVEKIVKNYLTTH
jgi:polyhydroxyalkanoate synthesis regulator phasin